MCEFEVPVATSALIALIRCKEREHQLSSIKDLQCGFGQGYLFSVPMERGEIDAWVQAEKFRV